MLHLHILGLGDLQPVLQLCILGLTDLKSVLLAYMGLFSFRASLEHHHEFSDDFFKFGFLNDLAYHNI